MVAAVSVAVCCTPCCVALEMCASLNRAMLAGQRAASSGSGSAGALQVAVNETTLYRVLSFKAS